MVKYDMWGARPEPTSLRVGGEKLQLFDGAEDAGTSFDYAICLGDLVRYSRTGPGLSFAAHELARFMQRPGSEYTDAAHRFFYYIFGHLDD